MNVTATFVFQLLILFSCKCVVVFLIILFFFNKFVCPPSYILYSVSLRNFFKVFWLLLHYLWYVLCIFYKYLHLFVFRIHVPFFFAPILRNIFHSYLSNFSYLHLSLTFRSHTLALGKVLSYSFLTFFCELVTVFKAHLS